MKNIELKGIKSLKRDILKYGKENGLYLSKPKRMLPLISFLTVLTGSILCVSLLSLNIFLGVFLCLIPFSVSAVTKIMINSNYVRKTENIRFGEFLKRQEFFNQCKSDIDLHIKLIKKSSKGKIIEGINDKEHISKMRQVITDFTDKSQSFEEFKSRYEEKGQYDDQINEDFGILKKEDNIMWKRVVYVDTKRSNNNQDELSL